jgi:hypothetical protein
MQTDQSNELYHRYFALADPVVTVILKNGEMLSGVFVDFFRGEEDFDEPYVTRWHLVAEKEKKGLGTDGLGFPIGTFILQDDIAEIRFRQNNSVMKFGEPVLDTTPAVYVEMQILQPQPQ